MKFSTFYKLFLFLIISSFLTNCSSTSEEIPTDIEINDFVWKGLNAYYLWQSTNPNLADTRFNNQTELNNYLYGFNTPEILFEDLLNRPTDRFSWIVDDYVALENSFQGINLSTGIEFGLVRYKDNPSNVFGYVRYVLPNSSAENENVTRGMIFNTVDGTQITDANYSSLLFGSNISFTIGLADYNNGNPITNNTNITLEKREVQENPVAITKVITEGALKIGYLMYNQFSATFDGDLNAAFAYFKSENIDELIIDLRYNGGGSVRTATYLGSMITGQFDGELFSKEIWNEKAQAKFTPDNFVNNFTNNILNKDGNGNIVLEEAVNNLNLSTINFIVTGSTASASELLINSLDAYINVKLVGTKTVGKQVGSITLYDSDNYSRNGLNLNPRHTYAMQPIVLEIFNKDTKNEPLGFTPGTNITGIELKEDYGDLGILGERSDPLLDRMITYISTGAKGFTKQRKSFNLEEIYNSKLATPSSNNMYIDFKK